MNPDNKQHQSLGINLGSLVEDFGGDSTKITESRRRLFRTRTAGFLAFGLWIIFGAVIIWHVWSVGYLSQHLLLPSSTSPPEELEQHFDKAIALIGDTAKTLYAILGPLITAATSFYFTESAASDNSSNDGV